MELLIANQEIQERVKELAKQISKDHIESKNALPPVMICLLNGAIHFFSDLTRYMSVNCEIDFLRLKSYEGQDNSGGVVCIKDLELDLKGKRVYIIDDICDSGATILEALFKVNSRMAEEVFVVTLLRRGGGVDMTDYCGFTINEEWVIGYGLDNNGTQRELQDIYKLN
jgi:hypoxanthine phosphoribosyltransferase